MSKLKILVVAADYPRPGHLFSGIFNERSALALRELCDSVEVLAPRPYTPPLISRLVARWRAYSLTQPYEFRNGVAVHRPAIPVFPLVGSAFSLDYGAFLWSRHKVREIYRRDPFDAVMSFGLTSAGAVAWRIGRDLGVPASGWATGSDVRQRPNTPFHRSVSRTLKRLDLVFYQSHELLEKATELVGSGNLLHSARHVVLPRGISQPPTLYKLETRERVRRKLRLTRDQILVLNLGRVSREKGIFELLEAIALVAQRNEKIVCVLVGSNPSLDDTAAVERTLQQRPKLRQRVLILPACEGREVWEFLSAADIFAFTSHNEGMPNSLLEAMAMELPAVVFEIPPIVEIDGGSGSLRIVPLLDAEKFAEALSKLAASPEERVQLGEKARKRVAERFSISKNMRTALARLDAMRESHLVARKSHCFSCR